MLGMAPEKRHQRERNEAGELHSPSLASPGRRSVLLCLLSRCRSTIIRAQLRQGLPSARETGEGGAGWRGRATPSTSHACRLLFRTFYAVSRTG